jgi:hypothetical protein
MSQTVTINLQDAIKNIEGFIRERRENNRSVSLKAIAVRMSLLSPLYQAKVLLHLSKDASLPELLRIDMKNCASMIVENIEANRTAPATAAVQQMEKTTHSNPHRHRLRHRHRHQHRDPYHPHRLSNHHKQLHRKMCRHNDHES